MDIQQRNKIKDKKWRLNNFYTIVDKNQNAITFKQNAAQAHYAEHKHIRNIILKSRQLGFTTLGAVDCVDDMAFSPNFHILFLAHIKEEAQRIFAHKIKYAWEHFKLSKYYEDIKSDAGTLEIGFGKSKEGGKFDGAHSSIYVSNSGRSGTYARIHVTELAKMEHVNAERTREFIRGTIPALPLGCRIDIESTAEGDCYDPETQILTKDGWKYFYDLSKEDSILTMNPETEKAYYQDTWDYVEQDYEGDMYHFSNLKMDLLVTPKHKMYVQRQKGPWRFVEAQELYGKNTDLNFKKSLWWEGSSIDSVTIPAYTHVQGNGERTIPEKNIKIEDWLEYLGYFLTDGNVCFVKGNKTVVLTQKYFFAKMHECAKRIAEQLDSSCAVYGPKIVIQSAQLASYLKDYTQPKRIPRELLELNPRLLNILFEAMYVGDGDKRKREEGRKNGKEYGRIYLGNDAPICDDFQELVLKLGMSTNLKRAHPTCFAVTHSEKRQMQLKTYDYPIKKVPYNGKIYCVKLPKDHLLMVRRNGKSVWSGNSGLFYDMYRNAFERWTFMEKNGITPMSTDWKPHFYNWTWDKEEIAKVERIIPMSEMRNADFFMELKNKMALTDQEISYYYIKYQSLNYDMEALKQEYPSTWQEAFVSSGGKFFSAELLQNQRPRIGVKVGNWTVYAKNDATHTYTMGVDTAGGRGGDNAVICILDTVTGEQVAEFASDKTEPHILAIEAVSWAKKYGNAFMVPEINNHGLAFVNKVKDLNYYNVYSRMVYDKETDEERSEIGFNTNVKTKPLLLYGLSFALSEMSIFVYSEPLLKELQAFPKRQLDDHPTIKQVRSGHLKHFDRVIALALAWEGVKNGATDKVKTETYVS